MRRQQTRSGQFYTPTLTIMAAAIITVSLGAQTPQPGATQTDPSAQAQQQPPQQAQEPAATDAKATVTSADVSDAELDQFAKSFNEVVEINGKLQSDIAATQDPAQMQQIREQANERMAMAVRGHGMEVERFNTVARSLKTDAELNQRVANKRQQLLESAKGATTTQR